MMTTSNIERMGVGHLDEVLAIERSSALPLWSKSMFVEELRIPFAHCYVYRFPEIEDRPVVGFICFRNIGGESELLNIGVHPLYRRQGIGRALMQFYLAFGESNQIKMFYLEVPVSNSPAIELYRGFSYEATGTRRNLYQAKVDALIMARRA